MVAAAWSERLHKVEPVRPARDLYSGRSFVEAVKAATASRANLYVVSAGLGLVHGDTSIPSYNLTVSKGDPDCVMSKLPGDCFEADWWAALGGADALINMIEAEPHVVIIGLPSPYLRMIAPALARLSDEACSRVRIAGGRYVGDLDLRLERARLPYDDRLDGPQSPLPGTKSDFAARAARHFVEQVLAKDLAATVDDHSAQVEALMSQWTRPIAKTGIRVSDLEIKAIVREHWERADGRTTKLLRILRDELNVACEQKRFQGLAAEIREERVI
ncbi:hypothetical protein DEM27_24200 [Metarhizobium album]|uniref:DUF6884 domain-containing protein n=2 Tax=Metarhizobium album TaxID=2182425 RepID=A0A2U2DK31_9HYPH|nr:hypothetical protein DEM27_24200 [Rhizobium album]